MPDGSGQPRGIVHVHSSYSYDGRHSVSEIAAAARRRGLGFVCLTDHSDTLDAAKTAELVRTCAAASSPECLVIPGIEFTCRDGLHVLGIGVREFCAETDPHAVVSFIRLQGGLAVLAHPSRRPYPIPGGLFECLDGIEVWNCTYDGRFFPNPRSLALYTRARAENPGLVAFFGMDMHRLSNLHATVVHLETCALTEANVLSMLRSGRFEARSALCKISATPSATRWQRWRYVAQHFAYARVRRLRALLRSRGGR